MGPLYGNSRKGAYNIIKNEIRINLKLDRHLNAIYSNRPVGIMELVTRENSAGYRKDFPDFIKNLGFFRALKAYFFTFLDMPGIDSSTIYINNVAVHKDYRRMGVGTAMLSYAEFIARSRGKDNLRLWVASDNKAACDFYKKMGFYQLMLRSSKIAQRYMGHRDWVFMGKDVT